MSRSIRGIRHTAAAGMVGLALLGLGAGCSSSKSSAPTTVATTTTTLPSAQTRAAVRAYFLGTGAPVMSFLRTTAPLTKHTAPTKQACQAMQAQVDAAKASVSVATDLVQKAPPSLLSQPLLRSVLQRGLALHDCAAGQVLAGTLAFYVRSGAAPLQAQLHFYGIV